MNEVIKQLQNRRSVREFTGEKVKDEDLKLILETAQRYSNWAHGQQTSLIVVRDKEKIKKIAELSGGQKHIEAADVFILILIDFYRVVYAVESIGGEISIPKSVEGLMIGTGDAGIMVNAIQTAAESLGYGTTAIGGIRLNPEKVCELFDLPKYVFPILGTTIGVPAENKLKSPKPRVPFESFSFEEKYDKKKVEQGVEEFEVEYRKWWDENGLPQMPSYKQSIVNYYGESRLEKVKDTLKTQGFKLEK
jgi:CR(VI) reductase